MFLKQRKHIDINMFSVSDIFIASEHLPVGAWESVGSRFKV